MVVGVVVVIVVVGEVVKVDDLNLNLDRARP